MNNPELVDLSQPRQAGHATAEQLEACVELYFVNPHFVLPAWLNKNERHLIQQEIQERSTE